MTAKRNRWDAYHACRTSFDQIPLAPMLFDGSWRKLATRDDRPQSVAGDTLFDYLARRMIAKLPEAKREAAWRAWKNSERVVP